MIARWLEVRRIRRSAWPSLAAAIVLIVAGCAEEPTIASRPANAVEPEPALAEQIGPPNIVLILTDDQRWDTLWAMPRVHALLASKGVTFANAFSVNPVCCPSRTSILTGGYSHTTRVYTNEVNQPYGGFDAFDDRVTIATALQEAGYRTGLMGKYLNGYGNEYVPPGWDRWFATYDDGGFYDYTATDDGRIDRYGSRPAAYGTDLLADKAISFIEDTHPDQPLFLYFAPHAPHHPATPAPGDENSFGQLPKWRPPSYDEPLVGDKPEYLRARSLGPIEGARIDAFRLNQYRSLMSVDRAVGRLVSALDTSGRLENTMIVYASDNGMLWGEHRWASKNVPYEESIRVPLIVRYDALTGGEPRTDEHIALNIDLAPTFVGLAGTWLPDVDGMSLVPLLSAKPAEWRTDFLVEHLNLGVGGPPTFCAVRNERYKLVRYGTGERELYDLHVDPLELRNRYDVPKYRPVERELHDRLDVLCDPLPPGMRL